MLLDVRVGTLSLDHIWLCGAKRIKALRTCPEGVCVRLTGKVRLYIDAAVGKQKWTLASPYRNVQILDH